MRIIDAAQCYALLNHFLSEVEHSSCTGTTKQRNATQESPPQGGEKVVWPGNKGDLLVEFIGRLAWETKQDVCTQEQMSQREPTTNSNVDVTHNIKGRCRRHGRFYCIPC